MSSVDSSLLSGASYLAHNLYINIVLKKVRNSSAPLSVCGCTSYDHNLSIALRISVVILGIASTLLSLYTSTIYGLWVLAADMGYVVVFPQVLSTLASGY